MATIKYWNGTAWELAIVGKQGPVGPTGPTGPTGQATLTTYLYYPSAGATSISGVDYNGNTLAYTPGKEQVFLNGVLLVGGGADYTATTGTSITGLAALASGDVVEILVIGTFNVANAVLDTTLTTKGDLYAATAAGSVTRLGVGANNTVLTADSSTATGLKWATPSISKSYTLLNGPSGTAMTGATTITVNIASGYDNLLIMLMDCSAGADSYYNWRFNGDSGSGQYLYAGGAFKAPSTYSASISDKHESGISGQTSIETIQLSNNAASFGSVGMNIFGANSTGFKAFQLSGNANTGGGNDQQGVAISGIYKGSAAITSVSVISSSGNFDAGTIFIYGA